MEWKMAEGIPIRLWVATRLLAGMLADPQYDPASKLHGAQTALRWADALIDASSEAPSAADEAKP